MAKKTTIAELKEMINNLEVEKKDKKPRKISKWSGFLKEGVAECRKRGIVASKENTKPIADELAKKAGYVKMKDIKKSKSKKTEEEVAPVAVVNN